MSTTATQKMISAYNQSAPPTLFLSGRFQSPAENFYNSEEVEIDIERDDEDVAWVVTDLSTGYRFNSTDDYTNKKFKPPIFKEAFALQSHDLLGRSPGDNPYADVAYQAKAILRSFKNFRRLEAKIRRSVEWQASQILQTGVVTLIDGSGDALYTIDFAPKATHFPTVGTAWSAASPTIVADLISLDSVIRDDSLSDPDMKIFGEGSFEAAMDNSDFRGRFETRRADLGTIGPMRLVGSGGQFRGIIDVGNYRSEIWTYNGRYKHPQTGVKTKLVSDNSVISLASGGRMDATFGAIPRFVPPDARVMRYMPPRMSNINGGMDLFTNAWVTPDGETLMGGISSRPLLIPTAIDTFGCLNANL